MPPCLRPLVALGAMPALLAAAGPAHAAGVQAYVSQNGGAEQAIAYVSGCTTTALQRSCSDGNPSGGPVISLVLPDSAVLRFERATTTVKVRSTASGPAGAAVPAVRIDATHWRITLPADSGGGLTVLAGGGSTAAKDEWDALYVATVAPAVTVTSKVHTASGRRVLATLHLTGTANARFVAFITVDHHRVSTKVSGSLTTAAKTVSLRLGPKAWSTQRDRARLVVEYSVGGNAWTVASVALSPKSRAASK